MASRCRIWFRGCVNIDQVIADRRLPELPSRLAAPCIDSHTHLDSTREFSGLTPVESLAAAKQVGIVRVVDVGCDLASSQQAAANAEAFDEVIAAVAVHPNDAARHPDRLAEELDGIAALASRPRVRAIGETGLDYYRTRDEAAQAIQHESFRAHIEIAKAGGLALVIHDREAHADILRVLDEVGWPERVIMHCFSGDAEFATECLRRDAWISFPGVVTFKNAANLREALQVVPDEKLLVETDAPYLTPVPVRGRPNAPYLVPHTIRFIAQQLGRDEAELCTALHTNTETAFGGEW